MKLDAPVLFYLKHREQIAEWYGLRLRLGEAAHEFFCSLHPDLTSLSEDLDGEVELVRSTDGPYPMFCFARRPWFDAGGEKPRISIGFSWERTAGAFDFEHAFAGVLIDPSHPDVGALDPLRSSVVETGKTARYSHSAAWPAWHYVKPSAAEYWSDLTRFRREIIEDVRDTWDRFSSIISSGMAELVGK